MTGMVNADPAGAGINPLDVLREKSGVRRPRQARGSTATLPTKRRETRADPAGGGSTALCPACHGSGRADPGRSGDQPRASNASYLRSLQAPQERGWTEREVGQRHRQLADPAGARIDPHGTGRSATCGGTPRRSGDGPGTGKDFSMSNSQTPPGSEMNPFSAFHRGYRSGRPRRSGDEP